MPDERIQSELTPWDMLKITTRDWWTTQRASGNRTRFGHPTEIAEHILIRIIPDFIQANGDGKDLADYEAARGRASESEIIGVGEHAFNLYRRTHPEEQSASMIDYALASLTPQKSA